MVKIRGKEVAGKLRRRRGQGCEIYASSKSEKGERNSKKAEKQRFTRVLSKTFEAEGLAQ